MLLHPSDQLSKKLAKALGSNEKEFRKRVLKERPSIPPDIEKLFREEGVDFSRVIQEGKEDYWKGYREGYRDYWDNYSFAEI